MATYPTQGQTGLKEFTLADGILYGPVRSRRLGSSLGINVLPFSQKVCSFNCGYCQCGWTTDVTDDATLGALTFPTAKEIEETLARHLKEASERGEKYDSLTMAGNGEPTLHPDFANVVRGIIRARNQFMPGAKVSILSNAATLHKPIVREGVALLDERIMKLDAGSDARMLDVNAPVVNVSLTEIVDGIKSLKDVIIQSMFVRGRYDNTQDRDVDDWIRLIGEIKPRMVQIYSLDRHPADHKLAKVDRSVLEGISRRLFQATRVRSEVY